MKLSAQGQLRLAAKLAFAAGASSLFGVAHAADGTVSSTAATDPSSSSNANLQLAQAETATPASTPAGEAGGGPVSLKGVQVTGSRIKQPSLTSSSSMTLISDREVQLQGTVNVQTLINNMPQAFADFSTGDSNGATGTATVDLRDLGPQRTLVLIDGKRLMPGDVRQSPPSPDLNFIPAALIERVEILSGGASAVYGSDAVAGVVNFVMKKDFQGFQIDGQWSTTDHSDATSYDTTLLWGNNFSGGKGNVTMYAGYTRLDALTQDARDFSKCSLKTPASGDVHTCAGSRVIPNGRLLSYDRYYSGVDYYGVIDPAGTRTILPDDGSTFNFAPYNYLQRPEGRYVLGGFAHYEINRHFNVYGSAMFMDDHTVAQIAPSGLFGQVAQIPCNSPLLSAEEQNYLCNYTPAAGGAPAPGPNGVATVAVLKRMTEIGPRQDDIRHTDFRIQAGIKGDIDDTWSYDLSAQRGDVIFSENYLNDVSVKRAQSALNVTTDANGNPICAAGAQPGPGGTECVPLDIFQVGGITPAAADYIRGTALSKGDVVEQVATGSVTGDLAHYGIKSPLAASGVQVAAGAEYRTESLNFLPDEEFSTGDLAGQGGPTLPVSGAFQVNELFGEAQLPIVENAPMVKLFQIDSAYRWSNYSNSANDVHSWKLGAKWAPSDDLTLRASYQRATRAPAINELFSPQGIGLFVGSDPCSGATPQFTKEQCARTGVDPGDGSVPPPPGGFHGTYGNVLDCNSGQCNALFGGNKDLKSELSTTRSIGLVLTPTFLKRFSATIDYFDITVDDAIAVFPESELILCALDNIDCDKIHRAGAGGRLSGGSGNSFVEAINSNTGALKTKGIDFEANYRAYLRDWGLGNNGSLLFLFNGTYVDSFQQGLPGATFDCAGLFGLNCGNPLPHWRHKLRVTWETPLEGLDVSVNWRYFGGVALDKNLNNPLLKVGSPDIIDGHIDDKQYLDISGSYVLPTKDRNLTLRFGVNNVGGQNPPTVSSNNPNPISGPPFGNANTYPNVYDSLGRVFFLGLTANFQ